MASVTPTTPAQTTALRSLSHCLPEDAYLAGGVAIAAKLGHRQSRDLDFFVPRDFDPDRIAEQLSASLLELKVTGRAPGTLHLEVDGVPISILAYRYPSIVDPTLDSDLGVRVASSEDLLCMKLSAIASRGLARDFWDLYALLAHGVAQGDLARALELFQRKYDSEDIGHVVRSLVYFGEADAAPLPRGLDRSAWAEIKNELEQRVRALT